MVVYSWHQVCPISAAEAYSFPDSEKVVDQAAAESFDCLVHQAADYIRQVVAAAVGLASEDALAPCQLAAADQAQAAMSALA